MQILLMFGACASPNHFMNQYWNIANWLLRNKFQRHLYRNSYIFVQENSHKYVGSEIVASLSRSQCDAKAVVDIDNTYGELYIYFARLRRCRFPIINTSRHLVESINTLCSLGYSHSVCGWNISLLFFFCSYAIQLYSRYKNTYGQFSCTHLDNPNWSQWHGFIERSKTLRWRLCFILTCWNKSCIFMRYFAEIKTNMNSIGKIGVQSYGCNTVHQIGKFPENIRGIYY